MITSIGFTDDAGETALNISVAEGPEVTLSIDSGPIFIIPAEDLAQIIDIMRLGE